MASKINNNEISFEWWLEELKKVGIVISYKREPEQFQVQENIPIFYNQYFSKKPPIIRNFNLIGSLLYTPDYEVIFNGKLFNKLFGVVDTETKSLIEIDVLEKGNVYQETLFYTTLEDRTFETFKVYFDVKAPSFLARMGNVSSDYTFVLKRAMLYNTHGIIVNKVIPIGSQNALFNKTFMPKRYRYTDSGSQLRKIKGNYATLEDYLKLKDVKL